MPTRGKTAPNRLRRTDVFLALCFRPFLEQTDGLYVDLGYGENPTTTLETADRLRSIRPSLQLLGVEIDPDRVAAAQLYSGNGVDFRLGGFNLPLLPGEKAAVIRALNVLRQYPESEYAAAIETLGAQMVEGAILLEGTSDPLGRLMSFNLYRRDSDVLKAIGLVFSVSFRTEFQPRDLQAILPKNFIHHAGPGSPLDRFFENWNQAWQTALPQAPDDLHRRFQLAAASLAGRFHFPVELRPPLIKRGFLWLRRAPDDPFPDNPMIRDDPEG